jgi:hypothetical protein
MNTAHLTIWRKNGAKQYRLTLSTSPALSDAYMEIVVQNTKHARRVAADHGAKCWNF